MSSSVPEPALRFPLLMKERAFAASASADQPAEFDLELLARMRAGDETSRGLLFDRYSRMVFVFRTSETSLAHGPSYSFAFGSPVSSWFQRPRL